MRRISTDQTKEPNLLSSIRANLSHPCHPCPIPGSVLPEPEVIGCLFDDTFAPPLAVMRLHWPGAEPLVWDVPGSVRLVGPPPPRFGLRIHRRDTDSYAVYLLWDRGSFLWPALSRREVLHTSLTPLLAAMGTDLAYLLDQPVGEVPLMARLAECVTSGGGVVRW